MLFIESSRRTWLSIKGPGLSRDVVYGANLIEYSLKVIKI